MAKVVGGELPLKAVLGLLTLRHSSDARVQEENIELLALVLPPRAKLPDRGKAGGVERMELQPGARMCSPDRGHCALRLLLVARCENDLRTSPGESQRCLVPDPACRAGDDCEPTSLRRDVGGGPLILGHVRRPPVPISSSELLQQTSRNS